MQVQTLTATVGTLGQFMLQIMKNNSGIDVSNDVRKILQQVPSLTLESFQNQYTADMPSIESLVIETSQHQSHQKGIF